MVLPSFAVRHELRGNHPEGCQLDETDYAGGENMFTIEDSSANTDGNDGHENQNGQHVPLDRAEDVIDRRATLKTTHSLEVGEDDTKEPISPGPARRKSSILVDALSDPNSELARFLLANSDKQDDEERGFFDGFFNNPLESTFKSFRNIGRRMTADDNVIRSQKTNKSWYELFV